MQHLTVPKNARERFGKFWSYARSKWTQQSFGVTSSSGCATVTGTPSVNSGSNTKTNHHRGVAFRHPRNLTGGNIMKVSITVDLDNDTKSIDECGEELVEILTRYVGKIEDGSIRYYQDEVFTVYDLNGNNVGQIVIDTHII